MRKRIAGLERDQRAGEREQRDLDGRRAARPCPPGSRARAPRRARASTRTRARSGSSSGAGQAAVRARSPKSASTLPGITVSRSITHSAFAVRSSKSTLLSLQSLWTTRTGSCAAPFARERSLDLGRPGAALARCLRPRRRRGRVRRRRSPPRRSPRRCAKSWKCGIDSATVAGSRSAQLRREGAEGARRLLRLGGALRHVQRARALDEGEGAPHARRSRPCGRARRSAPGSRAGSGARGRAHPRARAPRARAR